MARPRVYFDISIDGKPSGRITFELFNDVVPRDLGFQNYTMDKKKLENIVGECYARLGSEVTSDLLDALKDLGFQYATQGAFTVGIDDVRIPPEKDNIIATARGEVDRDDYSLAGLCIVDGERGALADPRRGGERLVDLGERDLLAVATRDVLEASDDS